MPVFVGDAAASGAGAPISPRTKKASGSSSCSSSSSQSGSGDRSGLSKMAARASAVVLAATAFLCDPRTDPSRAMRRASLDLAGMAVIGICHCPVLPHLNCTVRVSPFAAASCMAVARARKSRSVASIRCSSLSISSSSSLSASPPLIPVIAPAPGRSGGPAIPVTRDHAGVTPTKPV
eukprot:3933926-Rhodomonas_salina.1